ncbi:hypothetical protein CBL_13406 [Carabus blaptoides fortunei]
MDTDQSEMNDGSGNTGTCRAKITKVSLFGLERRPARSACCDGSSKYRIRREDTRLIPNGVASRRHRRRHMLFCLLVDTALVTGAVVQPLPYPSTVIHAPAPKVANKISTVALTTPNQLSVALVKHHNTDLCSLEQRSLRKPALECNFIRIAYPFQLDARSDAHTRLAWRTTRSRISPRLTVCKNSLRRTTPAFGFSVSVPAGLCPVSLTVHRYSKKKNLSVTELRRSLTCLCHTENSAMSRPVIQFIPEYIN